MKRYGRWLIGLLTVALLAALGIRVAGNYQKKQRATTEATHSRELPIHVSGQEVIAAQPRAMALTVPASGVVQAIHSAVVKAYVAGELRGLTVREGDAVKKGQLLARVDATEVDARWRQAQQQADAARAQLAIAQRQHDNNQALVKKGFISDTALVTSRANLDAAQANLAAAQAAADGARKSVRDTAITSPMNGEVAQRFVQTGERVGVEARIVEIVDPSQLEIVVQLAPADSVQVRVGQMAQLQVPGAAADLAPVQARVARINPSAQAGSRTVTAYLSMLPPTPAEGSKNSSSLLLADIRPGLFLQGFIVTGQAEQLALPLTAVRTDKPRPYVQVLQRDPAEGKPGNEPGSAAFQRVAHRFVQLGRQTSLDGTTWVQITSGLAAGSLVLGGSAGGLREGTAVIVDEAAAPAPSGSSPGGR